MEEKLEFLLALPREKHFGRAAQTCGVSKKNLSSNINHLEKTLGIPLVDRGSRFFGFTAEGQRVLEWARRIVGDMNAMRSDVETMKQGGYRPSEDWGHPHGLAGHGDTPRRCGRSIRISN
ncbi:LysR family transcriptional regulator [Breoghania sp.]|uniref:LysR family transcriptional regulator n=1 Tax=Breoghania sp. TaxID=2065378 RepID=UPI00262CFA47|nr:LysR family transcriptional regulator [Breoghania sp.]MDJ0931242.1 LysR family transcriptional regulator [Breoghania sp.]